MDATDFDCPHCKDIGLRQIPTPDVVRLTCPRCKRVAAVKWLEDPEPVIIGQMSVYDYPETAA